MMTLIPANRWQSHSTSSSREFINALLLILPTSEKYQKITLRFNLMLLNVAFILLQNRIYDAIVRGNAESLAKDLQDCAIISAWIPRSKQHRMTNKHDTFA